MTREIILNADLNSDLFLLPLFLFQKSPKLSKTIAAEATLANPSCWFPRDAGVLKVIIKGQVQFFTLFFVWIKWFVNIVCLTKFGNQVPVYAAIESEHWTTGTNSCTQLLTPTSEYFYITLHSYYYILRTFYDSYVVFLQDNLRALNGSYLIKVNQNLQYIFLLIYYVHRYLKIYWAKYIQFTFFISHYIH